MKPATQKRVLTALQAVLSRQETCTQADLARELGINPQPAGRYVHEMVQDGLITIVQPTLAITAKGKRHVR